MSRFQVGALDIQVIYDGQLREDPHWFFIDRPTAEWQAEAGVGPAGIDRLGVHCLLVRAGDQFALLDTGLGLDAASPASEMVLGERGLLLPELARLGVTPEQIDVVVLSHGHTDHLGGNVLADGSPAFPRARYYLASADYTHFTAPDAATAVAVSAAAGSPFHVQQLVPLRERDQLALTDGEVEVLPGVRMLPAPGHTPGHVCVSLASAGEVALYVGDLLHHPIQADHPDWSPYFDWLPDLSARSRQQMLDRARAERALILTAHFPYPGAGRLLPGWTATGLE
jgi:glyoxylase-like metal-dependent hydrolase (beta-lactamase superfamily II)